MVDLTQVGLGMVFALVGIVFLGQAWRIYGQYRTVQDADEELAAPLAPGTSRRSTGQSPSTNRQEQVGRPSTSTQTRTARRGW